jgi:hypothetical protein
MLTIEILKQNTLLQGLTDDQHKAIAAMSENDENTVIGAKIGALHGQYDTDILGITGIVKNQGEKSYDYAKRVLNTYKSQIASTATIQTQLANAKTEIETLKSKLASNSGDEQLKQQLKDAKALAAQLQQQLTDKTNELTTVNQKHEEEIKSIYVDNAFSEAVSGLKFKAGITDGIKAVLLQAAKAEVLAKGKPDFVETNGVKNLVFRDAAGNVMNNPANNLNPFTVKELLLQTSIKDVIDSGRQQTGAGTTGGGSGSGSGATILDLTTAKTQIEADKLIEAHLLSSGLTRDSIEFAEQSMKLRTDNNVGSLPIR